MMIDLYNPGPLEFSFAQEGNGTVTVWINGKDGCLFRAKGLNIDQISLDLDRLSDSLFPANDNDPIIWNELDSHAWCAEGLPIRIRHLYGELNLPYVLEVNGYDINQRFHTLEDAKRMAKSWRHAAIPMGEKV